MKSYRCTICGEVCIGSERPSNCPFCGVEQKFILCLDKVDGESLFKIKGMSNESTKNLIEALNFETSNASFYKCASENGENDSMKSVFRRLAKIEREHADIIRKYMDLDSIEFNEEECSTQDEENITKARERVKEAVTFYKNAALEARESKISILFNALAEVEEGQYRLLNTLI